MKQQKETYVQQKALIGRTGGWYQIKVFLENTVAQQQRNKGGKMEPLA